MQVGDCIEAGLEVSCGDALGLGSEQILTWEPSSGQIRCLQPSQSVVAEEVAASGGCALQGLIDLLQHHSGVSAERTLDISGYAFELTYNELRCHAELVRYIRSL